MTASDSRYPPATDAAQECASYLLDGPSERNDLLDRLRENYECADSETWSAVVRTWFQGTSHIYCAAFIARAETEAEIDAEIEAIARELAS
jgi:hypothetical protein